MQEVYTFPMFNSEEIKSLRQDVDALGAQIEMLQEALEARHGEIMDKLEQLSSQIEEQSQSDVTQDDIEDLKATVVGVGSDVEEMAEAVKEIDEKLEESSS